MPLAHPEGLGNDLHVCQDVFRVATLRPFRKRALSKLHTVDSNPNRGWTTLSNQPNSRAFSAQINMRTHTHIHIGLDKSTQDLRNESQRMKHNRDYLQCVFVFCSKTLQKPA